MFQCYRGHSAHVTRVRFSHDHRFLLSIGGGDKALIQWRHDVEDLDSSDDDEPTPVPSAGRRAGVQRKDGGVEAWELVQVHPDALRRTPLQVRPCDKGGGGGGGGGEGRREALDGIGVLQGRVRPCVASGRVWMDVDRALVCGVAVARTR